MIPRVTVTRMETIKNPVRIDTKGIEKQGGTGAVNMETGEIQAEAQCDNLIILGESEGSSEENEGASSDFSSISGTGEKRKRGGPGRKAKNPENIGKYTGYAATKREMQRLQEREMEQEAENSIIEMIKEGIEPIATRAQSEVEDNVRKELENDIGGRSISELCEIARRQVAAIRIATKTGKGLKTTLKRPLWTAAMSFQIIWQEAMRRIATATNDNQMAGEKARMETRCEELKMENSRLRQELKSVENSLNPNSALLSCLKQENERLKSRLEVQNERRGSLRKKEIMKEVGKVGAGYFGESTTEGV